MTAASPSQAPSACSRNELPQVFCPEEAGLSPAAFAAHVNGICRYLALDDFGGRPLDAAELSAAGQGRPFDLVAVFGNQVIATVTRACELVAEGAAERVLFSGGTGHSTPLLFDNLSRSARYAHLVRAGAIGAGMAEADMMAAVATLGEALLASSVLIENRSTNTGENARFSGELIAATAPGKRRILVLQDPVMQRRTVLTLAKATGQAPFPPLLLSHAVFVPRLVDGMFMSPSSAAEPPPWEPARFLSMVLGEIERLRNDERGYGPKGRGFIPAEEVPAEVLASYETLRAGRAVR